MTEKLYDDFVVTLRKFVSDVERYSPNGECKKLLEIFDKLDMNKILLRYVGVMGKHEQQIKNKDESIFEEDCSPLPGLNLKPLWDNFVNGQKKKIFAYLEMILFLSNMIIKAEKAQQSVENTQTLVSSSQDTNQDDAPEDETNKKNRLDFNPYEGIGVSGGNYSVEEMFANMDCLQTEESKGSGGFGLGSIAKMLGVGNLNMDELTNQLNNMTENDIDETTASIQKALGTNDPKTAGLFTDMLTSLKSELMKDMGTDGSTGQNPLDRIMSVAESVAKSIKPKMENEKVDIKDIFAGNGKDTSPLSQLGQMITSASGDDQNNPLASMLGGLMGAISQTTGDNKNENGDANQQMNDAMKGMMEGPMGEMMKSMMSGGNPMENMMKMMNGDLMGQMMQDAVPKKKKLNKLNKK